MSKLYVAQEGHVVNIIPPVDVNGAKNSVVFSMKKYAHATILLQLGVTGAASTVTLRECDDVTPTNSTAIAFDYFSETTDSGDTLGAKTAATSAGFATSTNNSIFYVIEIDGAKLTDGYPYLQLRLSDPGAATFASAVAILSGARFGSDQSPTEIT